MLISCDDLHPLGDFPCYSSKTACSASVRNLVVNTEEGKEFRGIEFVLTKSSEMSVFPFLVAFIPILTVSTALFGISNGSVIAVVLIYLLYWLRCSRTIVEERFRFIPNFSYTIWKRDASGGISQHGLVFGDREFDIVIREVFQWFAVRYQLYVVQNEGEEGCISNATALFRHMKPQGECMAVIVEQMRSLENNE